MRSTARPAWTLAVVCLATFMLLLDISVVVVAMPSVRADLGGSFADAQWVLDAYTLAMAGVIMTGAALADRIGRRRVFAAGLAVFTLASGACAAAGEPLALNVARAVQGLGSGFLLATSIPVIAAAYAGPRRARAVGAWAATVGIALATGPLVGGLVTDGLGWRWIFLVNVPLGLAALAVVRPAIAESFGPRRPLDPLGLGLLTLSLVALVFGTVRAGADGWSAPAIVSAFAIGVVALAAFVAFELRASAPTVDLRLLRHGRLAAFVLAAFTLGAGFLGTFVFLSVYQQGGLGASAMEAGLRFLPITAVYAITAAIAGRRLLAGTDLVSLLAVGMTAIAAGLLLMLLAGPDTSWTVLLPGFLLAGVGWGIANPAMVEGALSAVAPAAAGMASGMLNFARQAGLAAGVAALGSAFHHAVAQRLDAGAAAVDAVAGGATAPGARVALAHGIDVVALAGAAIIVAGTATSLLLARGRQARSVAMPLPEPTPAG
jgi:EmrB/QacA subfamily drug resistance transporter